MKIINERKKINLDKCIEKTKDSHDLIGWAAHLLKTSAHIVQMYFLT